MTCEKRRVWYVRHKLPIFFLNMNLNLSIDLFFFFGWPLILISNLLSSSLLSPSSTYCSLRAEIENARTIWLPTRNVILNGLLYTYFTNEAGFALSKVSRKSLTLYDIFFLYIGGWLQLSQWFLEYNKWHFLWKILKLSLPSHDIKTSPVMFSIEISDEFCVTLFYLLSCL